LSYEIVKSGDGRRKVVQRDWKPWLEHIGSLYNRYVAEEYPSPFALHEQATVGLLVSAAALGGYLSYNEYELSKKGRDDKRRRVEGRADYWMECGGRAYSFEVKRAYFGSTRAKLRKVMNAAIADARCICDDECDQAVALMIAHMNGDTEPEVYETFASERDVHQVYRVGPRGEGGTFLFLSLVG
jgi:hypothetical protein